MSVDTRNLPAFINSNADFQAWCVGVHAQLVACGLIQTAESGQISNLSAVTWPTANSIVGYEFFRFNDSQQSSNPIFLKVEYGVSSPNNRPRLAVTAGSATNGLGSFTGVTLPRQNIDTAVTYTAGQTLPSYCSGDGSYIAWLASQDATATNTNGPMGFIVDRIRDATGTPTGEGYTLIWNFNNSGQMIGSAQSVINNVVGTQAGSGTSSPAGVFPGPLALTSGGSGAALGGGIRVIGQNVAVMPLMVMAGQIRYLKAGIMHATGDVSAYGGVTFQANNLGAVHTYQTLAGITRPLGLTSDSNLAILWE